MRLKVKILIWFVRSLFSYNIRVFCLILITERDPTVKDGRTIMKRTRNWERTFYSKRQIEIYVDSRPLLQHKHKSFKTSCYMNNTGVVLVWCSARQASAKPLSESGRYGDARSVIDPKIRQWTVNWTITGGSECSISCTGYQCSTGVVHVE